MDGRGKVFWDRAILEMMLKAGESVREHTSSIHFCMDQPEAQAQAQAQEFGLPGLLRVPRMSNLVRRVDVFRTGMARTLILGRGTGAADTSIATGCRCKHVL